MYIHIHVYTYMYTCIHRERGVIHIICMYHYICVYTEREREMYVCGAAVRCLDSCIIPVAASVPPESRNMRDATITLRGRSMRCVLAMPSTPGPHNKNPRHKIFAKGWVAQKQIFDRYLDGCAKIFQGFPRVGSGKTRIL